MKASVRVNVSFLRLIQLIGLHGALGFGVLVHWGCADRVMLDERFHDTRLTNWTVVDDPDTLEGASEWRVEQDGWLHQRSNIWGRRGDFLGRWFGTFLVAGDARWADYTLAVRAKPVDD